MKNIIYLVVGLVLVSCGIRNQSDSVDAVESISEVEEVVADEVVNDLPTERAKYNASETILTDLIHTKLEVTFDWKQSRLNGVETLTAKPHFYTTDELILKAKGMEINSVKLDGKDLTYFYKGDQLLIKLGKRYTRDEQFTVVIDYIAKPEEREIGGSSAITSDKGLYFINPKGEDKNKMPQIWTQGETEASSVWFPTIDAPNSKTSQEIFMTVDSKYETLSNGKLISSKKNSDGTRTDHWKQELKHAPYLFMMAVGEFKIVKDSYTRQNGTKMDVNYYVEPEWEQYADDIFDETPEMIKHFSELLGVEYAWDKYNQIVVRDYVSGAMENTGAVVFGDYVYKTDRELLDENDQSTIAHELFHHWFGDYVTCESWSNLPLNESFANYSQYLWDEYRNGLDEANYNAEKEADGYFQSAQMQGYHNLIWLDYDEKEQMFDGHSYNKGGRILHMLRTYVGDEAFFASLKLYLTQNKFKAAEFHNLRLAFEEVTGEDLNWFFDQWFLGSGHPVLEVEETVSAGFVKVRIAQKQSLELSPIFRLPMQIAVFDDAGKHIHEVVVDKLEETFQFPVSGNLKCVIPDYQQVLLAKVKEEKPQAQFIQQYYVGETYGARDKALRYGTKKTDSLSQVLILDALSDKFWSIRSLAIEKAGKLRSENKVKATGIIRDLAVKDPNSYVRASALSYLEAQGGEENMESLYVQVIEKDSSYQVVAAALRNLGKSNSELAMQKAKVLESEPSSKMILGIATLYGTYGDASKFDYFESILMGSRLSGFDQLGTMNTLSLFVGKNESEIFTKAIPVYQHLKDNGTFYTQMFLPQNIDYLINAIEKNKSTLTTEVEKHTEEGNVLYADQARKKLAEWVKLEASYKAMLDKEEE